MPRMKARDVLRTRWFWLVGIGYGLFGGGIGGLISGSSRAGVVSTVAAAGLTLALVGHWDRERSTGSG